MNKILTIFSFILFLNACKPANNGHLYQKWKTIFLKNNKMDEEIRLMQEYIDTLGQQDPELRQQMDVDSAKKILQAELNRSLLEAKLAKENTLMEFKQNGVIYTTSIDGVDSAMFTLEDKFIKVDEAKLKGHGETMTFEILKLSSDSLRLRIIDYGDTSEVTMVPVKS